MLGEIGKRPDHRRIGRSQRVLAHVGHHEGTAGLDLERPVYADETRAADDVTHSARGGKRVRH